ncbi:hypothetical protein D3C72_2073400 [compost metagenome]
MQRDLRVPGAHQREIAGEEFDDRGLGRADDDAPVLPFAHGLRIVGQPRDQAVDLMDMGQQLGARFRYLDAMRHALEQRCAQLPFQVGQPLGRRRHGQLQLVGCARNAAFLGNGQGQLDREGVDFHAFEPGWVVNASRTAFPTS